MKILTGPNVNWASTAELVELPVEEMREFVLKDRPLPISYEEYSKLSYEEQGTYKSDHCGWFLFGVTDTGSRVKDSNLVERDALVFDIEHDVPLGFPAKLAESAGYEMWWYSTLRHTPQSPRYRIIIPFKEPLTDSDLVKTYKRISLQFAEKFEFIHMCDPSSWRKAQAQFMNCVIPDCPYSESGFHPGELLDPQDYNKGTKEQNALIEDKAPKDKNKKTVIDKPDVEYRQDPKKQRNAVGAVARAYGMKEGIEKFLSPKYLVKVSEGRYKDPKKSSKDGVTILPEKEGFHDGNSLCYFHYANHGLSDDCSHTLYDLMNYYLDPEEFKEILKTDEKIKAELPGGIVIDPEAQAKINKLPKNEYGTLLPTLSNIKAILRLDPNLKDKFYWNDLSHGLWCAADLYWRKVTPKTEEWVNTDYICCFSYLNDAYGLQNKERIYDAIDQVALSHRDHAFRRYTESCRGLNWRIMPFHPEETIYQFLGGENTEWKRRVFKKLAVAAVKRNYEQYVKFDLVTILYSLQGAGKTSFWSRLLPNPKWYSQLKTVLGKEAMEALQGRIIVDMDEMTPSNKAEAEQLKAFETADSDKYRPPYGKMVEDFSRTCVLVATSNKWNFLKDPTGERRHCVLVVDGLAEDGTPLEFVEGRTFKDLERWRDYIWAWALECYEEEEKKGKFKLSLSPEERRMQEEANAPFRLEKTEMTAVREYVDRLKPEGWKGMNLEQRRKWLRNENCEQANTPGKYIIKQVSPLEIMCEAFGQAPNFSGKEAANLRNTIEDCLAQLGWQKNTSRSRLTLKNYTPGRAEMKPGYWFKK